MPAVFACKPSKVRFLQWCFFVKPPRPSIAFRSYKSESSATVVDAQPWFVDSDEVTHARPMPWNTPAKSVPMKPAVARPVTAAIPALPQVMIAPGAPPPSEVLSARTMVAVAPPATPHAAPSWSLPVLPIATIPIVERKEHPSFGPVAFDVVPFDESWDREARTVRVARPQPHPFAYVAACAAAALLVLAGIAGGTAIANSNEGAPAIPAAAAAESAPMAPAALAPAAAPEAPPSAPSFEALPLTPEQLFPKDSATSAAPPTRGEKLSAAEYRVQKARFAADLAKRNAPTLLLPPNGSTHRRAAPSVDELIRAARARGERD